MKNQSANTEQQGECLDLKINRIPVQNLVRNDLIFYENDIWRCQSVNMLIFQNLQSKLQKRIPSKKDLNAKEQYLRVQKLQLIPKQWRFNRAKSQLNQSDQELKIELRGQQLGLGPVHQIQVIGMRRFQELQVVKSQKQRGREVSYKVILCRTKKENCYLISAVDFIN